MSQFGMGHRLLGRRLCHGLHRRLAERPARGGEHDLLDALCALEVEHLVDGIVLRIDREQRRAAALDLGQHERAGADQALLVGEADDGASRGCRERGPEARCADDPGHDEIGGCGGGLDQGFGACRCDGLRACERLFEGTVKRGIADDGLLRADLHRPARRAAPRCAGRSAPRPRRPSDGGRSGRWCCSRSSPWSPGW